MWIAEIWMLGCFGSYLDINSAVIIGMFPMLPLDRFYQVGNAAGAGATLSLISQTRRTEAHGIARQIRYIELAGESNFNRRFLQAMAIGY